MQPFLELLKRCAENHSFDSGDPDCKTVLDQLYRTHAESHEDDPPGIRDGFKELDALLENLPLDDNNAVFNLCCRLCTAYEQKAFLDGIHYGAQLMMELKQNLLHNKKRTLLGVFSNNVHFSYIFSKLALEICKNFWHF